MNLVSPVVALVVLVATTRQMLRMPRLQADLSAEGPGVGWLASRAAELAYVVNGDDGELVHAAVRLVRKWMRRPAVPNVENVGPGNVLGQNRVYRTVGIRRDGARDESRGHRPNSRRRNR